MKRTLVLIVLALALTLPTAALASHSWGGYHWSRRDSSQPLVLRVGDNMTADWKGIYGESLADWDASSVLQLNSETGSAGARCKAVAGTIQACNGAYGYNGWLGLAQIWLQNGHIYQGVAKMNDSYFALAAYNNYSERRHVLCQEVGHTFGLGHTSEDGSSQNTCMDYYQNTTDDRISIAPNAHDYELLVQIYNHQDAAAPSRPGKGNNKAQGNGRDVFVEDLGNGRQRVTFVFWAPDFKGAKNEHAFAEHTD